MSPKTLAIASVALMVAGSLLAALAAPLTLDVIAIFIGGVGFVGLISSAFLAIGLSEDRARERDTRPPR
ncbi:hypothetical protein [Baekduia sp. Peel2402]|uniref:hypothetical protein n=1 Tax=Baekduia sp. Peel2402 TaxID=3458296 RepID=UPI00403EF137